MHPRRQFRPRVRPPLPAPRPAGGFGAGKLALALLLAAVGGVVVYKTGERIIRAFDGSPQRKIVEYPIQDKEWSEMVAGMEKLSKAYRGYVGIYMKDLETGRTWEYRADRRFPSASLIKVPIMAAVFEKVRSGALTLDTQVRLTRSSRVGGSGSLKWVRDGTSLSVMELLYKMITESDNTAAKMLINTVGMDYLSRTFQQLGLEHTNITREGMSLTSRRVRKENYTTPREMALLMERIYDGELVDAKASEFMMETLKHTHARTRLRRGLPLGWEIGNKTGLLRRSCHDVGVVFSPRGDYVIAVLTSKVPSYSSAKRFISKVARQTYKYYKLDADYAGLPAKSRGG